MFPVTSLIRDLDTYRSYQTPNTTTKYVLTGSMIQPWADFRRTSTTDNCFFMGAYSRQN